MSKCAYIYDKEPEITEEDRKLKWLPIIKTIDVCPRCNGAVTPVWDWIQVGLSPWMEESKFRGVYCYNCKKTMDLEELKTRWVKSYHAYDIYLSSHKMTNEDYDWFRDNGTKDIRKFPKTK